MSDLTVTSPTQTGRPTPQPKLEETKHSIPEAVPPPVPPPSLRRTVSPYLTKIIHGSAPFISTFIMIHLTPPVLASVGGSSLASQVMLLGREYYQTSFGERYLLLLPLDIHVLAAISKRLLSFAPPRTSPTKSPRPITSLLSITGYSLFLLLRIHYHIHRVFPQDSSPSIDSLGPSELDFEFVKYGIQHWPLRSWFLYGGLTLFAAWHASEGLAIIYNTFVKGKPAGGDSEASKKPKMKLSRKARVAGATLLTIPAFAGLWVISTEPLMAFNSLASRFHAIFTKSPVYRF